MRDNFCHPLRRNALCVFIAAAVFCGTLSAALGQSYLLSTLAGMAGSKGTNDGINQQARFNLPAGIAVDSTGALYVADFQNHTVRKMARSGDEWAVTTIAGTPGVPGYADGTNSDAKFNLPTGVAVDLAGNVFVSERYNHTVREIRPVGTNWVVTTVAGLATVYGHDDGTNADARFYLPSGIAVDSSDHLFVADSANFTIRKISPLGTNWVVTTIAGSPLEPDFLDGTGSDAYFNYPYDVALSDAGNLYVADWGNSAIRELTSTGVGWRVKTIAGSGTPGSDDGLGTSATFYNPTGVAVDSAGVVYVADQSNDTIRKLIPGSRWAVTTLAGKAGIQNTNDGVGTNALFKHPWGITVDKSGALFVTDWGNSTIRHGQPFIPGLPALQITYVQGQAVLAWPASLAGYELQTSARLGSLASWLPVTASPAKVNDQMLITNPIASSSAFFRLQQRTTTQLANP